MAVTAVAAKAISRLSGVLERNDQDGLPYLMVHTMRDEREVEFRLEADGCETQGVLTLYSDGSWNFACCGQ